MEAALVGLTVEVSGTDEPPGKGSVQLSFSDGSIALMQYWRILTSSRRGLSNFDQRQKYGLASPIDAVMQLQEIIGVKAVSDAAFDSRTGDIEFAFETGIEFHVFNFTGYEVWEVRFVDGTGEYSNNAFESSFDS